MSFVFTDRESTYPNRYLITRDNGSTEFVVLERADEPVVPGTPLNAETFNALSEELAKVVSTQATVTAISIVRAGSVVTMTNTLDNNTTEVLEVALDEQDTPTQITANGVVIPLTWEGF
jgi:hypothetical protein